MNLVWDWLQAIWFWLDGFVAWLLPLAILAVAIRLVRNSG